MNAKIVMINVLPVHKQTHVLLVKTLKTDYCLIVTVKKVSMMITDNANP